MFSDLFDKNNNPSARKIATNNALVEKVKTYTSWMPVSTGIAERLWIIKHDLSDYPKQCKFCEAKITTFRSWSEGYKSNFCNTSCSRKFSLSLLPIKEIQAKIVKSKKEIQDKRIETSIDRYGVAYPWQNKEIKNRALDKKKLKTGLAWISQLEQHGLNPKFSNSDYVHSRSKLLVSCKTCNTEFALSRFASTSGNVSLRCPTCRNPKVSIGQYEVNEFIKSFGFLTRLNDRQVLAPMEMDIYVESINLGIEYDGLYWHSERGRPDIKNALTKKLEKISNKNIKTLMINDSDWVNHQEIVKSRISSALGKNTRIFARTLTCKQINKKEAITFLNANHLQGSVGCTYAYGLFNNLELIGVMTFGKPRFAKCQFEMLRYASKVNCNIVGGGSKLLRHFVKAINPTSIITYSDNRWGDGNFYNKLGFKSSGQTGLGYFYVSTSGQIVSRNQAQKHKLPKWLKAFDESMTEHDNMLNAGFSRVWTPGSSRWIYRPALNVNLN